MSQAAKPGPRIAAGPQVVIVLLVVGLAGAMAITPTRELLEQRTRIAGMTSDLRRLQQANRHLRARIERLNDPDYLEQQAREQFGLVRPGETAYVVIPKPRRAGANRRAASTPHAALSQASHSFIDRVLDLVGLD